MKTNHAPGPWNYRVVEGKIQVVIPHQFTQCRKILTLGLITSDDCDIPTCCRTEEHANAKLISAAPDLLEALNIALLNCRNLTTEAQEFINKAIEKATK